MPLQLEQSWAPASCSDGSHRRLADGCHRGGVDGSSDALEREQSTAHGGDSGGRLLGALLALLAITRYTQYREDTQRICAKDPTASVCER